MPNAGKPNVLFIVLDALRYDHLSCYGYKRKTCPNIDHLAENGWLFENAFSAGMWTPPSHASMFTGLYPKNHGVLGKNISLPAYNTTMADVLSEQGYRTILMSPGPYISKSNGMGKGFQVEHQVGEEWKGGFLNKIRSGLKKLFIRSGYFASDYIFWKVSGEISKSKKEKKPFFVFINYADTHHPYIPKSRPWKFPLPKGADNKKILKIIGQGMFRKRIKKLLGTTTEQILKEHPLIGYNMGTFEISGEEWEQTANAYDSCLWDADASIGQLVDFLRKNALLDDTIIVITSDHGENLGDHGLSGHEHCIYDTLLHVPLILYFPKSIKPKKRKEVVSLVDILPTILEFVGVKHRKKLDGIPLTNSDDIAGRKYVFSQKGRPKFNEMIVPKQKQEEFDFAADIIRDSQYKYALYSNGKEELFDYSKDPAEEKNLVDTRESKAGELKKQLLGFISSKSGEAENIKRVIDSSLSKRF
ncbi:sulfatase-like hydrolase/transferase [Candidatus Micrarchaeota archaeon]|nr:sulfatase-like hydrolase/transferase [Candidatus Micrarchaeota archaeon]